MNDLTERQKRELEYHKEHAQSVAGAYRSIDFDVVSSSRRRWWNAYWDVWTFILKSDMKDKRVLVVGCGAGEDALRFAKIGASVYAFDLSAEMLAHGTRLAAQYDLPVQFAVMPSEQLSYPDDFFDVVFARDILHHVDIPKTMSEIARVSKPGAILVVDEIYSHSVTDLVRKSALVAKFLYPRMQKFVYGNKKPYITIDERKLSEGDVALVKSHGAYVEYQKFFNCFATRIFPDKYVFLSKADRLFLLAAAPLAHTLAGRIVFALRLRQHSIADAN